MDFCTKCGLALEREAGERRAQRQQCEIFGNTEAEKEGARCLACNTCVAAGYVWNLVQGEDLAFPWSLKSDPYNKVLHPADCARWKGRGRLTDALGGWAAFRGMERIQVEEKYWEWMAQYEKYIPATIRTLAEAQQVDYAVRRNTK